MFILASSSRYRQAQLKQIGLNFTIDPPRVDEKSAQREQIVDVQSSVALKKAAANLAVNLAKQKALSVAPRHSEEYWIIGADQVASNDENILNKPLSLNNAIGQLEKSSGKSVDFHTAVCLVNRKKDICESRVQHSRVRFRSLTDSEILSYLNKDRPFDCAGSFKWESLGIALFDCIESQDPTALTGLPLISLCKLLLEQGINPLL